MYAKLKKKFGQNFLIDKNILEKIFKLIEQNNLNILEIGPGNGNLTEYIINSNPKYLTLIEVDSELIENLKKRFHNISNIKIINDDFLKNNKILDEKFDLVVSNLPYNISSQVLIKLSISYFKPKKMILMFQKEFADRLLDKNLNSLNSIIKCFYKIKKRFEVSNNSFYPIPKVRSSILEFTILDHFLIKNEEINDFILFKRLIFNKKRKKLGSILKSRYNINISNEILDKRAETLSLKKFVEVFYNINF